MRTMGMECSCCGEIIPPGAEFHLAHDGTDNAYCDMCWEDMGE